MMMTMMMEFFYYYRFLFLFLHCVFITLYIFLITPSDVNQFLPRDAIRKHGFCCRPVSVRLHVTLVDCIHTAEDIVKLLVRLGSPIILVFWIPCTGSQFQGKPLQQGHKIHRGGKILRFSTKIAVYLGNGTR